MIYDLIVIGGGAAGVFAALQAKAAHPDWQVLLLEKSAQLLSKVRVSGGGRCNVTHACFDPIALAKHYPRGSQELIGPFSRFGPKETIAWFEERNAYLKEEADGRIFPTTDSSQTIIDTLLQEAEKLKVSIQQRQRIQSIEKKELFEVHCLNHPFYQSRNLLLATGSSLDGYAWAKALGHTIQPPVPSLFTFNVPSSPLKELSGVALPDVELKIAETPLQQRGPLLITHFGFSGPAILKLSAWGARTLFDKNYHATLLINWIPEEKEPLKMLLELKTDSCKKSLANANPFLLPKNLWKSLIQTEKPLQQFSQKELHTLVQRLQKDPYAIEGKTTHKEEFVTCGGVTLKEINFKTMESRRCPSLYFAGEILDIDGITGGFNFQNAWTTAYLAGRSMT